MGSADVQILDSEWEQKNSGCLLPGLGAAKAGI